ncbi:HPP family protein [Methylocystis sp. IM2]|uniref:HPP family protein n=1 Tax=unclassified Methylocystis TaxID=2625913 RepID=UPI004047DD5C
MRRVLSGRILRERAYAALLSSIVLVAIGGLGIWARQPWLFPSLGPTIFLQTVTPNDPGARLWNTLAGHAAGVCAGFLALFLVSESLATPTDAMSPARVGATAFAVGLTIMAQYVLKALHPPAAATTMLVTLGGLKPDWGSVLAIAMGVALVSAFGEAARLLHPERNN